jgi:hypothetical protein
MRDEIAGYLADSRSGEGLRAGLALALIGLPNSGKSPLLKGSNFERSMHCASPARLSASITVLAVRLRQQLRRSSEGGSTILCCLVSQSTLSRVSMSIVALALAWRRQAADRADWLSQSVASGDDGTWLAPGRHTRPSL